MLYIMLGKFENRLHLCNPCVGEHDVQGTESLDGFAESGRVDAPKLDAPGNILRGLSG